MHVTRRTCASPLSPSPDSAFGRGPGNWSEAVLGPGRRVPPTTGACPDALRSTADPTALLRSRRERPRGRSLARRRLPRQEQPGDGSPVPRGRSCAARYSLKSCSRYSGGVTRDRRERATRRTRSKRSALGKVELVERAGPGHASRWRPEVPAHPGGPGHSAGSVRTSADSAPHLTSRPKSHLGLQPLQPSPPSPSSSDRQLAA